MESHIRSIAKAVTWRLLGSVATFAIAWLVTRRLPQAAAVGLGDLVMKVGAYYVHERIWAHIGFGRVSRHPLDIGEAN